MKAVQIHTYGDINVLEVSTNVHKPILKNGQILVSVHAASINPFDMTLRSGRLKEMIPLTLPITLGGDISGVVTDVSLDISNFGVGDEVYGQALVLSGGSGGFAEIAAATVTHMAHKPEKATFEEAASLVLVGVSALQVIEEHIKLQANQKILIHGGAGGIGSIAIQIAKASGAYVITTVSGDDRDFAKALGADEVIDYKAEKFEEKIQGIDAVFDTVGGLTTEKSFLVLKKGGILVSMVGKPSEERALQYGVTVIGQNTRVNTSRLNRLKDLVDSGKVKAKVDKTFSLDHVQEAATYLEKESPRGKVVLVVK